MSTPSPRTPPAASGIPLHRVSTADPAVLFAELRGALAGIHAVLPYASGTVLPPSLPRTVPAGTAVVVHTSGSTGIPKSVAISAAALRASATATADALGGPARWVTALPTHLISGIHTLVRSQLAGAEPLILPPGPFDPAAVAALIRTAPDARLNVSLVPAQLRVILDHADAVPADLPALQSFGAILVGGQGVPHVWRERAHVLGLPLRRSYGSTETSGGCVYDGVGIGDTRVRIRGGEVQVSGPTLAEGYLGDPEQTARHFIRDGDTRWYRTGDAGELMGGVLSILGRLDNVIVSGGVNVSLDRVEQVIRGVPGCASAVVLSRPSERWGTVPVLVLPAGGVVVPGLVPADAGRAMLETVRVAVVAELGRAAVPAELWRVDEVPLLPGGKPDRQALRRLLGLGSSHGL
ncbi:AMP-binding protein [Klugiella xanthotipulae]|uniref:O-succinylbenzoic acid--CoA ligase n=1 Tax=Klugiella xanthotipulae TaxID=244735 RepID=A0A543HZ72_9MICO|nr:AMP-binding protein [Klugiella xanthotipulae]TQM63637.1 O-succinylbenzoic acid--CoA ligase [Klugiella xanthotipulae]